VCVCIDLNLDIKVSTSHAHTHTHSTNHTHNHRHTPKHTRTRTPRTTPTVAAAITGRPSGASRDQTAAGARHVATLGVAHPAPDLALQERWLALDFRFLRFLLLHTSLALSLSCAVSCKFSPDRPPPRCSASLPLPCSLMLPRLFFAFRKRGAMLNNVTQLSKGNALERVVPCASRT